MQSGGKGFEPFIPEEELFFLGKSTQLDNVRTVHVQDCFINPQEMVRPSRDHWSHWPRLPMCLVSVRTQGRALLLSLTSVLSLLVSLVNVM